MSDARPLQALDDRRARRRLKLGIGLFVLALAIPSALLVLKAYDQMKWESFRAQQLVAEELAARIDERLADMVRVEEARPVEDYAFLRGSRGGMVGTLDRSPLAELDGVGRIPGLIGYFEVAADGRFSSPLVPRPLADASRVGLNSAELALRQARAGRIQQVLVGNRLVERPESDRAAAGGQPREAPETERAAAAPLGARTGPASAERADADQGVGETALEVPAELAEDEAPVVAAESMMEAEEAADVQSGEWVRQAPNLASAPAANPASLAPANPISGPTANAPAASESPPVPKLPGDDSPRLSQAAFARLKSKDGDDGLGARAPGNQAEVALPQLDESFAKRSRRELKAEAAGRLAEKPSKGEGLGAQARKAAPAPGGRPLPQPEPAPAPEPARRAEPPTVPDSLTRPGSGTRPEPQVQSEPRTPDQRPTPGESVSDPSALGGSTPSASAVELFKRTLGPIEVGLLDSGHLLLFRTVRRGAESLIQGALIEQAPFLQALIAEPLAATVLARNTHLSLAYRGELLSSFRAASGGNSYRVGVRSRVGDAEPPGGALLYRTRLREPFGGFELIFSVSHLPTPPGAAVIGWMAAALVLVLLVGAGLMYRLGARQLALLRQQQDFVSAVSHELKTPLTSIRLYAEMLSAGLAPEERKGTYYRFIHEESERLSRLINNVLQLARIGRGRLVLEPRAVPVGELLAMVRERVAHQVERAGFTLRIGCREDREIVIDPDAGVQILLNLIDNALKFGGKAALRQIDLDCERAGSERLCICVRDYGPGIPREQRKRVFELFYRGDQARHAAVAGTGIGLALVWRLTQAMQGQVDVIERDPGVEFRLELPLAATSGP